MKWYYSGDMIMNFLKRNPQYRICTLQFYIKYYKSVIFDDTALGRMATVDWINFFSVHFPT